jgi:hypothetical protein
MLTKLIARFRRPRPILSFVEVDMPFICHRRPEETLDEFLNRSSRESAAFFNQSN